MTRSARVVRGVATGAAVVLLWPGFGTRSPEAAPAALSPGGRVHGDVEVVTRPSRRLATPGAYPSRTVGVRTTADIDELDNVIVYLNLEDADAAAGVRVAPTRATIRQTGEVFVPHVVAVTVGSTVAFPNDDLVFHNVFALSGPATFDLGRYPRGDTREWTFDTPGLVKVYCHLHSHMNALIRVFDHPYFAIPDRQGRFTIADVPDGAFDVVAWHERVGAVSQRVVVRNGQALERLSFSLPLQDGR